MIYISTSKEREAERPKKKYAKKRNYYRIRRTERVPDNSRYPFCDFLENWTWLVQKKFVYEIWYNHKKRTTNLRRRRIKKNYKELSRRCVEIEEEGMTCGPISMLCVASEAVLEIEEGVQYLTVEWISEVPDSVSMIISSQSIIELLHSSVVNSDAQNKTMDRDTTSGFAM